MKASEMMTSDWVMPLQKRFRGIPGQVVTIDGGTDICWIDCDDYSCLIPCSDVEGIPITPEILEKNGFEDMGFYSECKVLDWRVLCDAKNVAILHREHCNIDTPVEYVHDLQHALKLCRIDKEIVI